MKATDLTEDQDILVQQNITRKSRPPVAAKYGRPMGDGWHSVYEEYMTWNSGGAKLSRRYHRVRLQQILPPTS